MNSSDIHNKNIKALAAMTPAEGDRRFAAASLEEFKQLRERNNTCAAPGQQKTSGRKRRPGWIRYALYSTSAAAVIALGIILFTIPKSESEVKIAAAEFIVENAITSTEYTTAAGEMRSITLSDGSKVWLNANTTLRVPTHFQQDMRKVELLEGEAYFDVTHDERAPFIVSTIDMEIKVLGTEFNVFAYKGYETKASLVRGSIKAYSADNEKEGKIIKPNESIEMARGGKLLKESFSARETDLLQWKNGKYIFADEPLSEIVKRLELYYGTVITIENEEVARHRYSGKFRRDDGLEWILLAMSKAYKFEVTSNEAINTITIK